MAGHSHAKNRPLPTGHLCFYIMLIDIVFSVLMLMALSKGLRRGLIVAVFSVAGLVIGLAAAMKFSTVVARHLHQSLQLSTKWLPVIAFIAVFICVVLIVRWAANLLEAAVSMVWMEWLNKLGAVILYGCLYTAIYSVLLFYAKQLGILSPQAIATSRVYGFVEPWGPTLINALGRIIPLFKDMFTQLEDFFAGLG
jgi:membrane protein required for colicin V production